ncbi:hypothetical protein BH11ACT4_BH11ACT4_18510 [soil metagenome]
MKSHTIWAAAGAAVLTAAMVTGGALSASADTPAPTPTNSSNCNFGEHLVELWKDLPDNLQADLKNLKSLPQGQRAAAAKDIRQGALSGKYGPGVQRHAERVHGRAFLVWGDLPESLRADLKDLKAAAPADRPAKAKAIGDKAIAGDYGDKVQAEAKKIQSSDFWQRCVAG